MKNQDIKSLATSIVAGSLLLSTALPLEGAPLTRHPVEYPAVTVEHAELVLGNDGSPERAYLTIYNGSGSDIALSRVSVAGYKSKSLVQRTRNFSGYNETPFKSASIIIPRRAEIDMGRETLFVSLDGSGSLPRRVTVTLDFNDGTTQEVPATILAAGEAETSHHHGTLEME